MTHAFDVDIAMEPADPGTYQGRMSRRFWIYAGPNGGYVAAAILRGLSLEVGDPDRTPRSMTVHFTERPEEGAVTLYARVERAGRRMTTVSGRLVQGRRTVAVALATFGVDRDGYEHQGAHMPEVPAPEDCLTRDAAHARGAMPPMLAQLDMRWAVGPPPFSGDRSDTAIAGCWIRSASRRNADDAFVTLLCDAVTPAIFSVVEPGDGLTAVPTVELTIHFRNHVPETAGPDDFYLAAFRTGTATGGFVEEDGEVWTRDGLLLAQSRQLAVLL